MLQWEKHCTLISHGEQWGKSSVIPEASNSTSSNATITCSIVENSYFIREYSLENLKTSKDKWAACNLWNGKLCASNQTVLGEWIYLRVWCDTCCNYMYGAKWKQRKQKMQERYLTSEQLSLMNCHLSGYPLSQSWLGTFLTPANTWKWCSTRRSQLFFRCTNFFYSRQSQILQQINSICYLPLYYQIKPNHSI